MTAKSAKTKLFQYEELVLCVDLPTSVSNEVTKAGGALMKSVSPAHMQIFWIPADIAHVAVLHTGRVREDLVGQVKEIWQMVLQETSPFTMKAAGSQLYQEGEGEEAIVRAIWISLLEVEPLLELREKLISALADLDVNVVTEAYEPHIPLALVEDFRNSREFNSAFVEWQEHDFGEIPVTAMLVKQVNVADASTERPFQVLGNLPLGSAPVEPVQEEE